MFDEILSTLKQSLKCHRQLYTIEGNNCYNDEPLCVKIENHTKWPALHYWNTRSGRSIYEARISSTQCNDSMHSIHQPRVQCLLHFWDYFWFDKMLSNTITFEVWVVHLVISLQRTKSATVWTDSFLEKYQLLWISDVPKSCGLISINYLTQIQKQSTDTTKPRNLTYKSHFFTPTSPLLWTLQK